MRVRSEWRAMTRSGISKVIFFLLIAAVVAMLLIVSVQTENVRGGINFAEGEEIVPNTVTLSSDGWEKFTYRNASPFVETVFDGQDAYYYELDCGKEEQYSMTAVLTSPELEIYGRDYVLGIKYFTRQRETVPDKLSVEVSSDGKVFTESGSVECFDNGAETAMWRDASVEIKGDVKFIRFVFTVYYSGEGADRIDDSGLYLNKEFTLTAKASGILKENDFTVELSDEKLYYNGEAQYPDFEVGTTVALPYYYRFRAEKNGAEVQPVEAGEYTLVVDIYDDANALISTREFSYTVGRQTITLTGYEAVSNGEYVVLLDAMFTDGAGRTVGIEEAGCDRIFDAANEVVITVTNAGFEPYSAELGTIVPDAESGYVYFIENKDVETVYDGTEKSIDDYITVFSEYDFETGEFTTLSAGLSVNYFLDGNSINGYPVNAGEYVYRISYGTDVFEGTLKINPKEINSALYGGDGTLDKIYDGTTAVAENNAIVKSLTSLIPVGAEGGDEVNISAKEAFYARDTGRTYIIAADAELSGADAGNYYAAAEIFIDVSAVISPTTLDWTGTADKEGGTVSVTSKQYDNTAAATIENNPSVELVMKGLGKGIVRYGDIKAEFDGKNAGERNVVFTLINETLYDKYNSEIILDVPYKSEILPRTISAEATAADGTEKTYDGSVVSFAEIKGIAVADTVNYGDGFGAALKKGDYSVTFEKAEYDSPGSGNRVITVTDITVEGNNRGEQAIFSNYKIEELQIEGKINPKEISVLTEKIRIYNREALPDIETTAGDADIIKTTVYATRADAENGVNPLPPTTAITENGEYFVKAESASSDYVLTGETIIPLIITAAQDKEDQCIDITEFNPDIESPVAVPVNGTFAIDAVSRASTGEKTGLKVGYAITGNAEINADGTFTALTAGEFTITVYCDGNSHYNAAEDVVIEFEARNIELTAEIVSEMPTLYAGDTVPSGDILKDSVIFKVNGVTKSGTVDFSGENNLLSFGENQYLYEFSPDKEYIEKIIDFNIKNEIYELSAEGDYVLTSDTVYKDNKEYYVIVPETVAVAEGENLPENCYERTENGYKPTEDVVGDGIKEYYTLEISKDDTLEIRTSGYYVYSGGEYLPLKEGGSFSSGERYYYYGKVFYGKKTVGIKLSAEKRNVTLVLGGESESYYGAIPDFTAIVTELNIGGNKLPYSEIYNFGGGINLVKITVGEDGTRIEERVGAEELVPGDYRIYGTGLAPDGGYEIKLDDEEFMYNPIFTGEAVYSVAKSEITVFITDFEKYYYTSELSETKLRQGLGIEGIYVSGDETAILDGVEMKTAATRIAAAGDYAVLLEGITENDYYIISYRIGYIKIKPVEVTLFGVSNGHVYGNEPSEVTVGMAITSGSGEYLADDIAALKEQITAFASTHVSVTAESDVGDYPIDIYFNGNSSNYKISFGDGIYTVSPATLSEIYFYDENVLYDGERHSLKVRYDENKWQDITVKYNEGYFVEKGVYDYVAVVSKKNYKDLTLYATLTIGTLTVSSSSLVTDAVSVTVSQSECENGLSPELFAVLRKKDTESSKSLTEKIENDMEGKKFEILGSYDIGITLEGADTNLYYSVYELTLRPSAVKYSDGIIVYGYGEDGYGRLEYEYKNGVYYVKTTSLKDIAFVTETEEKVSPVFIWVGVGIFAALIIIVLAIVAEGSKRGKRERERSRRRHHRWV